MNRFLTAAVALVATGAITAAPLTPVTEPPPSPPETRVVNDDVRLAAASIANIPLNLFYAIANIPANLVAGLNSWADALEAGGSWWLKTPTNVWGWDPANPSLIQAATNVLFPFPVISGSGGLPDGITPNGMGPLGAGPSEPITAENSILGGKAQPGTLGYILNVWAAAELPMHENCGFECYDVLTALGGYFQVPESELAAGYTFSEDIPNPNDPTGEFPAPWAGQTAAPLDFAEPFVNFVESLMEDPPTTGAIKPVSIGDIINVSVRLYESGIIAFSPWFSGSFLFTGFPLYEADILISGLIKGVIQRLCPACGIAPDTPPETAVPATDEDIQTVTLDVSDTQTAESSDNPGELTPMRRQPELRRSELARDAEGGDDDTETTDTQQVPEDEGQIADISAPEHPVSTGPTGRRTAEPVEDTTPDVTSEGRGTGARRSHDTDKSADKQSESADKQGDSGRAGHAYRSHDTDSHDTDSHGTRSHDKDSGGGSTAKDHGE